MKHLWILITWALLTALPALAAIDSQSNGQDGALDITENTEIDLGLAVTGAWNTAPTGFVAGNGVYDPDQWAVVFHYTDVHVAPGVTVTFKNHPSNPPVVWLVQGSARIEGTVKLDGHAGGSGANLPEAAGGPGGFRGGRPYPNAGWGMGPGGGAADFNGAYASLGDRGWGGTYGNPLILPLIGGSGGGGQSNASYNGGGGGGAILIAAGDSISIIGTLRAIGGDAASNARCGSGGAIKLVSDVLSGGGALSAVGNINDAGSRAGTGRICVLANTVPFYGPSDPVYHLEPAGSTPQIWPDTSTPTAEITEINGIAVPTDPIARLDFPWQDVLYSGGGTVTCTITTTNVPTNGTVSLYLTKSRANTRKSGTATLIGGNTTLATWSASVTGVTNGMYSVLARAVLP